MESKILCQKWQSALESWAIPEAILSQAVGSPWELRPESFAPSETRASSPTVLKIIEMLSWSKEPGAKSVLDVGCGAGGVSLLVLSYLESLIAVDSSGEMLDSFKSHFDAFDKISVNLQLVQGSWLSVADEVGRAAVVVCANVLYNVPVPCEFIMKLNDAAMTGVVLEIHESHPHSVATAAWKHFWNLDRPVEPTGGQLLELVESLGLAPGSLKFRRDTYLEPPVNRELVQSMRRRLCLDPSRDDELEQFLTDHPIEQPVNRLIWWRK